MKLLKIFALGFILFLCSKISADKNKTSSNSILLNGIWEIGLNRNYTHTAKIPGLLTNPAEMTNGQIWCKRKIILPPGDWEHATLELKGALFAPEIYIDGILIAKKNGGMAPLFIELNHKNVKPNNQIVLEIALSSLKDVKETDASYVAKANHWRSNISSLIWDDVQLHLHGEHRISRIIPFTNLEEKKVIVKWELKKIEHFGKLPKEIVCELSDKNGNILSQNYSKVSGLKGEIEIPLTKEIKLWSPEEPNLYNLKLKIITNNKIVDEKTIAYGAKSFVEKNKQFYLNGNLYPLRMGTVVWHRFLRDPEAKTIAFDEDWFYNNVIKMLKDRGANALRFHIGNAPEKFISMCDKYGLLVQYEWSFFHGIPASEESLIEQWKSWLDLGMQHPSIALVHPYNESEVKSEIETAWLALNKILPDYPPLVIEDRDVLHIHRYWWSIFENVGLFYDSYKQYPKAVMADEFGGNYLDGFGNPGGYPKVVGSFERWLGKGNTKEMRNYHHTISNSRIAEYWRRIGVAGFSPFCILGSFEDGCHWYDGKLIDGKPKSVWNALTAAWSPQSISLNVWDRNFSPNQEVTFPLHFFNDTNEKANLKALINIEGSEGQSYFNDEIETSVEAHKQKNISVKMNIPLQVGDYIFKARLDKESKYPIISEWNFRVLQATPEQSISKVKIGVDKNENELITFFSSLQIKTTDITDTTADIIVTSQKTWERIVKQDGEMIRILENAIENGKSIVMLDVGSRFLGQEYPNENSDYKISLTRQEVKNPKKVKVDFIKGVKLSFLEKGEPESHIHPSTENDILWKGMKKNYAHLWNGYRGGLIVPAVSMEISGLKKEAFISKWKSRGANEDLIKSSNYIAYELEGYYAFTTSGNENEIKEKLRERVKFIIEDAPGLNLVVNVNGPIQKYNLSTEYQSSTSGKANKFNPLVKCGYALTKTPVAGIEFGEGKGKIIISQLLTQGRLAYGFGTEGEYGIRYDESARQMVLNMLMYANEK